MCNIHGIRLDDGVNGNVNARRKASTVAVGLRLSVVSLQSLLLLVHGTANLGRASGNFPGRRVLPTRETTSTTAKKPDGGAFDSGHTVVVKANALVGVIRTCSNT